MSVIMTEYISVDRLPYTMTNAFVPQPGKQVLPNHIYPQYISIVQLKTTSEKVEIFDCLVLIISKSISDLGPNRKKTLP